MIKVLERLGYNDKHKMMVRCLCDCGKKFVCGEDTVKYGKTKSCGCLKRKYTIDGQSLWSFLGNKNEYNRVNWLINNKYMTPEEAIKYHRKENPDAKWVKKVNNRRRIGIDEKYLEAPSSIVVKMGHIKQSKYLVNGELLSDICKRKKINLSRVYNRIYRYGLTPQQAVEVKKKELIRAIKEAKEDWKDVKKTGYVLREKELRKKINESSTKRKIINLYTLEIYSCLSALARKLDIPRGYLCEIVKEGRTFDKQKYEYLDVWLTEYPAWEKEKYSRRNNIYFLGDPME